MTQGLFSSFVPIIIKSCASANFADVTSQTASKAITDLANQRKNEVLVQVNLNNNGKQDGRPKVPKKIFGYIKILPAVYHDMTLILFYEFDSFSFLKKKVLEILLTDEEDPYFLYSLEIGEDSFHSIRNDQNLLVDFQQFPEKLIELLQECINCRNDDHPK